MASTVATARFCFACLRNEMSVFGIMGSTPRESDEIELNQQILRFDGLADFDMDGSDLAVMTGA